MTIEQPPVFDGETYDPQHDEDRLSRQLGRVWDAMKCGTWRTLEGISTITRDPTHSISARLRDLRKIKFGNYTVERRSKGDRERGLFEYRLLNCDGDPVLGSPVQKELFS